MKFSVSIHKFIVAWLWVKLSSLYEVLSFFIPSLGGFLILVGLFIRFLIRFLLNLLIYILVLFFIYLGLILLFLGLNTWSVLILLTLCFISRSLFLSFFFSRPILELFYLAMEILKQALSGNILSIIIRFLLACQLMISSSQILKLSSCLLGNINFRMVFKSFRPISLIYLLEIGTFVKVQNFIGIELFSDSLGIMLLKELLFLLPQIIKGWVIFMEKVVKRFVSIDGFLGTFQVLFPSFVSPRYGILRKESSEAIWFPKLEKRPQKSSAHFMYIITPKSKVFKQLPIPKLSSLGSVLIFIQNIVKA